jgi:hypothetical protein
MRLLIAFVALFILTVVPVEANRYADDREYYALILSDLGTQFFPCSSPLIFFCCLSL